jgi:putative transposase
MTATNINGDMWHWHHNVSESYYHIQLTIKYRKSLFNERTEQIITEIAAGFKERYAIEITHLGFDKNHVHLLCRFLPKYSGGQVIRLIKMITAKQIFKQIPEIKKELWGGEFWTDGYYFATVSGRGDRTIIERYIEKQGRTDDIKQLRLFEL